jgi:hypothetical protein
VHDRLETIRVAGAGVIVQDVSVGAKPVPEIETVVPGVDPRGGEPTGYVLGGTMAGDTIVTAAVTVNVGPGWLDMSP